MEVLWESDEYALLFATSRTFIFFFFGPENKHKTTSPRCELTAYDGNAGWECRTCACANNNSPAHAFCPNFFSFLALTPSPETFTLS
jgi:hypothetical protein